MIKLFLYTCFVSAFSLGFSSGSADLDSTSSMNIEKFVPDDDNRNTIDRRKRAHKRKRQIRPRRNGF